MFTLTLFCSVKLTASKSFYLNFTPKRNDYKPFTSSNYTVKDSFDFAKYITQKSSKLLPLMWISFSQTCHLMKLLKYVLTNYLNLIKRFQCLKNNKFQTCFVNYQRNRNFIWSKVLQSNWWRSHGLSIRSNFG